MKKHSPTYYAAQGVCLVILVYVFVINFNSLPSHPMAPLAPERWKPLTTAFGLGQRWGMFESIPSKDGWYVARAKLKDGSEVDLLRQGATLDWRRPEFPARHYPNHFWQKLFREMAYDDEQGFQVLRAPVAKYFCRHWNAQKPIDKQIDEFEFIYCIENKSATAPSSLREQLVFLDLSEP